MAEYIRRIILVRKGSSSNIRKRRVARRTSPFGFKMPRFRGGF